MEEVLNDSDFDAKVLASDGKVLVEFFATWCPHCQRMQPILDDVAAKAAGACAVYQVDVDKSPDLAAEYAPNGFPTYVLFMDGSKMKTLTGEQTEAALLGLAQQA